MSYLKDERDDDPVERGGRDEWGACCWFEGTRLCHCEANAEMWPAATPTLTAPTPVPVDRPARNRARKIYGGHR